MVSALRIFISVLYSVWNPYEGFFNVKNCSRGFKKKLIGIIKPFWPIKVISFCFTRLYVLFCFLWFYTRIITEIIIKQLFLECFVHMH